MAAQSFYVHDVVKGYHAYKIKPPINSICKVSFPANQKHKVEVLYEQEEQDGKVNHVVLGHVSALPVNLSAVFKDIHGTIPAPDSSLETTNRYGFLTIISIHDYSKGWTSVLRNIQRALGQ